MLLPFYRMSLRGSSTISMVRRNNSSMLDIETTRIMEGTMRTTTREVLKPKSILKTCLTCSLGPETFIPLTLLLGGQDIQLDNIINTTTIIQRPVVMVSFC